MMNDDGIFIGLYNHNSPSLFEPYPEGTPVSYPTKICSSSPYSTHMRGIVILLPIPSPHNGLPISDADASPYVIRLIDGLVHQVSPDTLGQFVTTPSSSNHKIRFPSGLGNNQKVMFLKDGLYVKGVMEWSLDENNWRFSQCHKNGVELFGVTLPNFCQDFQKYIDDDGSIIPGWQSGHTFTIAGSTRHVFDSALQSITPPRSVIKALHTNNPDKNIWYQSYKEEYNGLTSNNTFDIISEEEYQRLRCTHGVRAIPSMCTFVIKHNNGVPTRA
jgi:hypothetical protein